MEKILDKISVRLTDYLIKNKVIEEEKYAWYKYAFYSGIMLAMEIIFMCVLAAILSIFKECIMILLAFFLVRSYAGGYHMKKVWTCAVSSNLLLIGASIYVKYFFSAYAWYWFVVQLLMTAVLLLIGPVETPNKKLRGERKNRVAAHLKRNLIILDIVSLLFWQMGKTAFPMCVSIACAIALSLVLIQLAIAKENISDRDEKKINSN